MRHNSQIEDLRIGWTLVGGDGLGQLACLPNLVVLQGPAPRQEDEFVSQQGLAAIAKCTNLQSLLFRVGSDGDLYCLRSMSNLRHLDLGGSTITGRGLGELPAPERLLGLELEDVYLTEAVNAPLQEMTNLRAIRFAYSPVEDDTLSVLAKLKNLEMINLDNTLVTDKGLSRLRELPRLKELSVTATRVSHAGAAEFRKARPDVDFNAQLLTN